MATRTKRSYLNLSSGYQWTASGSGTNEYYLEASGGGDPGIAQPTAIYGAVTYTSGTAGSLDPYEWAWADNDTLGYSTVYIRTGIDVPENALVEYKFNDGSGSSATDSSGNSNTGSIAGSAFWDTNRIEGSHALFFDGTGDSLSASGIGGDLTKGVSLSTWLFSDGSITGGAVCRWGTATDYLSLDVVSTNLQLTRVTSSSNVYTVTFGTPTLTSGWHHIAFTHAPGADPIVWVDGTKYATVTTTAGTFDNSLVISGTSDDILLGGGAAGDLEADLDVFRLWSDYILSDDDVTVLSGEDDVGIDPDSLPEGRITAQIDTIETFDRSHISGFGLSAPRTTKTDGGNYVTVANNDFSVTLLAANEGRLGFRIDNESAATIAWLESDTQPTNISEMMELDPAENYFSTELDGTGKLWVYQNSGGALTNEVKITEYT
jgi:hypothetical protein